MIGAYLIPLLLIGLSGILIDLHRRSWQSAQQLVEISPGEFRYARSQYRRRVQTSGTIGALGGILALYPLVPRAPLPITLYLLAITLTCLAIMLLAVIDAWATRQNFLRLRTEQLAAHLKLASELSREQASPHDG